MGLGFSLRSWDFFNESLLLLFRYVTTADSITRGMYIFMQVFQAYTVKGLLRLLDGWFYEMAVVFERSNKNDEALIFLNNALQYATYFNRTDVKLSESQKDI